MVPEFTKVSGAMVMPTVLTELTKRIVNVQMMNIDVTMVDAWDRLPDAMVDAIVRDAMMKMIAAVSKHLLY